MDLCRHKSSISLVPLHLMSCIYSLLDRDLVAQCANLRINDVEKHSKHTHSLCKFSQLSANIFYQINFYFFNCEEKKNANKNYIAIIKKKLECGWIKQMLCNNQQKPIISREKSFFSFTKYLQYKILKNWVKIAIMRVWENFNFSLFNGIQIDVMLIADIIMEVFGYDLNPCGYTKAFFPGRTQKSMPNVR